VERARAALDLDAIEQNAVTVAGDEMTLDLSGSSPQTPGCLNCGLAQTISGARLAFKFLFNPDVPVIVPWTILNVGQHRPPAACTRSIYPLF